VVSVPRIVLGESGPETMKLKKSCHQVRHSVLYPMANGLVMTFLDDNTWLSNHASLKSALDARDGKRPTLDSNPQMQNRCVGGRSPCGASSTSRNSGHDAFGAGRRVQDRGL